MAGFDIPDLAVARSIGEVVDVVVHIERRGGSSNSIRGFRLLAAAGRQRQPDIQPRREGPKIALPRREAKP
jgi:hypothetical protein